MARKPRFNLPGIPQHVIQRGNNREPCFYSKDDYCHYLQILEDAAAKNCCAIHAYVLMTNHVHLLVTPFNEFGVSHMMQDIGRKYVRYINHQYKRSGTLWEGRYKASLIDSNNYLLTCMRYIELNPVRALMVEHPSQYPWSSYRANAVDELSSFVRSHPVYELLASNNESRRYRYRELFSNHIDYDQLHNIRQTLNQEMVLGRDDFKLKVEQMTHRQVESKTSGRPKVSEEQGMYCLM